MKTLDPIKKLISSLFLTSTILVVVFVFATPAFAYNEDTHFVMTYVICRSVGFTSDEAMIIAAVDQGMDDSPYVVATGSELERLDFAKSDDDLLARMSKALRTKVNTWTPQQWHWHALDLESKMYANKIVARRDELLQEALQETSARNKLIRFGVFFHYQQDTWAHRLHWQDDNTYQSDHLSDDNFYTYSTPFGHFRHLHWPDHPPYDPVAALRSLEDGIKFSSRFLKEGLGREPNAFLANYVPQAETDDPAWDRKGKQFNQINISDAAPGSARHYLLSLIRAQIAVYKESDDDTVDFNTVRLALQNVWIRFKTDLPTAEVDIPTRRQKEVQGFAGITSEMLNNTLPTTPQLVGVNANGDLFTKDFLDGEWTPVKMNRRVKTATVMPNGTILGVTKIGKLVKKAGNSWVGIDTKLDRTIQSLGAKRDGTILGVRGAKDSGGYLRTTVYTRKDLKDGTQWVARSQPRGNIISISVLPDGRMIAVDETNGLIIGNNLYSEWQRIEGSGGVISVTALPDGTILGVSKDTQHLNKWTVVDGKGKWVEVQHPGEVVSIAAVPMVK